MLLTLLLPLFFTAGLAYLLTKKAWLTPLLQNGVSELTAKILIPALLLSGTYKSGLPGSVSWQLLGAFYLPLIGLFLIAAYLTKKNGNRAPRALAAVYSNTVFVGIPVLTSVFGESSLQFAFPVIAFHSLIAFMLYFLAAGQTGAGKSRVVNSLLNTVKNPIIISLMGGLTLNFSGIILPKEVNSFLSMLSNAALPCALLALGASLASLPFKINVEVLGIVATKLIVLPICVLTLAVWVFNLPKDVWAVLLLIASCPVGVNASMVVAADAKDPGSTNTAILLSSFACTITIPAWLWLLTKL